jgi:hypothetical protein
MLSIVMNLLSINATELLIECNGLATHCILQAPNHHIFMNHVASSNIVKIPGSCGLSFFFLFRTRGLGKEGGGDPIPRQQLKRTSYGCNVRSLFLTSA